MKMIRIAPNKSIYIYISFFNKYEFAKLYRSFVDSMFHLQKNDNLKLYKKMLNF
jgi:hypothetical protein